MIQIRYKITYLFLIIAFCISFNNLTYAAIIKQEVNPDGIVTYYVSNKDEKFLAFSMMYARMESRSKVVYTNKYIGDTKNLYDYMDYRYSFQNNVINIQHGIGSFTST